MLGTVVTWREEEKRSGDQDLLVPSPLPQDWNQRGCGLGEETEIYLTGQRRTSKSEPSMHRPHRVGGS